MSIVTHGYTDSIVTWGYGGAGLVASSPHTPGQIKIWLYTEYGWIQIVPFRTSMEFGPGAPGAVGRWRLIITGGVCELQECTGVNWSSHTYHGRWP